MMKYIVPKVARTFRFASHLTVVSGFVLLGTTGYLFDRWIFSSTVYVPPMKAAMMALGTLGGLAMWVFVHMFIWPALRILLGEGTATDPEKIGGSRPRAALCTSQSATGNPGDIRHGRRSASLLTWSVEQTASPTPAVPQRKR